MAKSFHLTIAKVGEHLFDGDAESVTLPGAEGVFTVLANHMPFVSELKKGEARVKTIEGGVQTYSIHEGGVAEVSNNQVTVLL
jgi:F-type H+-transporting ATPase subunit epsilon